MTTHRASSLLDQLKTYQDRALDIVTRAEALLHRNDPALAPALAQTRWETMRATMPYSAFKHGELFPALIDSGRPEQIVMIRRLRSECLALADEFKAYVAHWSSVSVTDHWPEYRSAALAIIARLRAHMARERRAAEAILMTSLNRTAGSAA